MIEVAFVVRSPLLVISTVLPSPLVTIPMALSPATVAVRGTVLLQEIGVAAPVTVIGVGEAGCVQLAANEGEAENATSVDPSAVPRRSRRRRFGTDLIPTRKNASPEPDDRPIWNPSHALAWVILHEKIAN